jgi:hypothetical protein
MLRLEQLVAERQRERFALGVHDCSMWACDAVLAVTGRDPGSNLRGTYATEADAEAVIAAGGGLARVAADRLGAEILPAQAAVGDVGLIETERGPALVVCMGKGWLAAAPIGLAHVHRSAVLRAWRCEVI